MVRVVENAVPGWNEMSELLKRVQKHLLTLPMYVKNRRTATLLAECTDEIERLVAENEQLQTQLSNYWLATTGQDLLDGTEGMICE